MRIRDVKILIHDPGCKKIRSWINIPDPQHCTGVKTLWVAGAGTSGFQITVCRDLRFLVRFRFNRVKFRFENFMKFLLEGLNLTRTKRVRIEGLLKKITWTIIFIIFLSWWRRLASPSGFLRYKSRLSRIWSFRYPQAERFSIFVWSISGFNAYLHRFFWRLQEDFLDFFHVHGYLIQPFLRPTLERYQLFQFQST